MTNKLILNERIRIFLDENNKQIWDSIIQDGINVLPESLPIEDTLLSNILKELSSEGRSETLDSLDFSIIEEGNNTVYKNLVKLLFSLKINGGYEDINKLIEDKLFDGLPSFIEKIQKEVIGYPMRRVYESILTEAAAIRASLIQLIYLFRETDDIENLHSAIMMRTKITLAIMANHKHILGYDMVEAAKIKEQIGEIDAALSFYNAVINNLKSELHWFMESPDMGPNEDDIIMLQALKESYISIDRLKNISESEKTCTLINEILSREYVDIFEEFDDEEDD